MPAPRAITVVRPGKLTRYLERGKGVDKEAEKGMPWNSSKGGNDTQDEKGPKAK